MYKQIVGITIYFSLKMASWHETRNIKGKKERILKGRKIREQAGKRVAASLAQPHLRFRIS